MEFYERLRFLREQAGYSISRLAEAVGVTEITVRNWERGSKSPSMSCIIALTQALHVSADTLLDVSIDGAAFENHTLSESEYKLVLGFRDLDVYGRKTVETLCVLEHTRVECEHCVSSKKSYKATKTLESSYRFIPKYTSPAAAGYAAPIEGDDYEMIIVDDGVPSSADFAVDIHGDSMMPHIHDGETVFVNRDSEISIGDVGIFNVNGETYCKQYYIDSFGNLTLVSSNPARKTSNVYVSANSSYAVRCYGKVMLGRKIPLPGYFKQ